MTKFDKTTVVNTLAKFYHDEEFAAAKVELCKCAQQVTQGSGATPTPGALDRWSKLVNSKGAPISRRATDPLQRRLLEADDVVTMLTMLDVGEVALPTFVAADLDRIPGLHWCAGDALSVNVDRLAHTFDDIVKRMACLETTMETKTATVPSVTVDNVPNGYSTTQAINDDVAAQLRVNPLAVDAARQPSKSFASLAAAVAVAKPAFNFGKPVVRGRGQADCSIKAVPRQLTCFVGRIEADVTEAQLHEFLTSQSIPQSSVRCQESLLFFSGQVFS